MQKIGPKISRTISVLIVDDSLVFRRFLGDIFQDHSSIQIVGEAQNGIEALDIMLKTRPDVILLDMEMPLMDGMTTLQHLMIHRPTPTIMFSSLTEEGTARCFDTLKNGAIDFLCKDFIFQQSRLNTHKRLILDKLQKGSLMKIRRNDPLSRKTPSSSPLMGVPEIEQRVVFCEECGGRQVVTISSLNPQTSVDCSNCGDVIELLVSAQSQYRRNNFISVLGGGEGSFSNLLQIIPQLPPDMSGAVLAVIHQKPKHVTEFCEYMDAISPMKVLRAREGIHIEGGNCYIASGQDFMSIKPYSAQLTLQKVQRGSLRGGALDVILASVATVFKKRAAGFVLSGDIAEGDKGMAIVDKYGGLSAILTEDECYSKVMSEHVLRNCRITESLTVDGIVESINKMHNQAKTEGTSG